MTTRIFRIVLPAVALFGLVLAFTQPVLAKPPACYCNICVQVPPTDLCTDPVTGFVWSVGIWCGTYCAPGAVSVELTTPVAAAPLIEQARQMESIEPQTAPPLEFPPARR